MVWVVGIAAIAIGIAMCFFGYRLFRIWLAAASLLAGAYLGDMIGKNYLGGGAWPVILAVLIGVLFAAGAYFVYRLGVVLTGAVLGAIAASLLVSIFTPPQAIPLLIGAAVGAVLASIFIKPYIIVGSAFNGAYFAGAGAQTLFAMQTLPIGTLFSPVGTLPWYILLGVLALTVIGAIAQFRVNRGRPLATGKK